MHIQNLGRVVELTARLAPIDSAIDAMTEEGVVFEFPAVSLSKGAMESINSIVLGELAKQKARILGELAELGVTTPETEILKSTGHVG